MRPNIILFYPRLGWMDAFILDLPLSVVYAAFDCQKNGIDVRIIDQRIEGKAWRESLLAAIDSETILVGFSAMSGNPILHALEATRLVKHHHPTLATVWGGMHVTICPDEAMREPSIDFIVRGLGSLPMFQLTRCLWKGEGNLQDILGLGWKENGHIRLNEMACTAEYPPLGELRFEGLPMDRYTRFNYKDRVYSLFTSFGCPHNCRFCFAPIFWKGIKGRRWFPYAPEDVVEHVVDMVARYKVGYISLLDENFFMDLRRAEKILSDIYDRGVRVNWGIRGARIDDLDRMSDAMYALMVKVGVRQIMIGAESGSPRVLRELMKKGITPEQTIRVNKRLSQFPSITPSYNFLSGLPNETEEDMFLSVDLILQLMEDNPQASFSGMNQFIPFPGSELFNSCVEHGFTPPDTLEKWAVVDTHYNQSPAVWLDTKTHATLNAIQAALMFADRKVERELGGAGQGTGASNSRGLVLGALFSLIILGARLYRPIALFRLRRKFFKFPIDYMLIRLASSVVGKISSLGKQGAAER